LKIKNHKNSIYLFFSLTSGERLKGTIEIMLAVCVNIMHKWKTTQ